MTKEKIELVLNPEISKWRKEQLTNLDLMEDIREKGQLQNLVARRLPSGKVELISGHRRYIALQALGMKPEDMDIKILENVSERDAVLMAIAENTKRQDMSAIEEGRAFRTLMKLKMPLEEVAMRNKVSETYVRTRLELLELPDKIQELMEQGEIEMSYAKPLNRLKGMKGPQNELVKQILKGKESYYSGIRSVENANEFVEKTFAEVKFIKKLVAKYGPCPECGSKDIHQPSWPEEKLHCRKCDHTWHRDTKDPWEFFELKQDAEKLGLKVEIGDGTAKITQEDIAEVMKRIKEERAKEKPLPKTMRSTRLLEELLAPFIAPERIYLFRVEGDKVEIKLIGNMEMRFSARRHNYRTGEKTQVRPLSMWGDEKGENPKRVMKFLDTLELQ